MALGGVSTGYGSMSLRHRLFFDGDEQNYEAWEEKFLGYLLIKDLKKTAQAGDAIDNTPFRTYGHHCPSGATFSLL